MGELAPWPKALEAWEPELRLFARELVGHLAPLSERIANAVGPLRISTERRSDEPNGYSALSRRGPYERLLISEWALQLEHEDEFIRRATSGEHLFVELERRSPAVTLEAWLLLDTGPSQLGTPRIAHLAALVAFTRRAREAGVVLHWAPLWSWEHPAHEALNPATLQSWLAARTAYEPSDGVLEQWSRRMTGEWPGGQPPGAQAPGAQAPGAQAPGAQAAGAPAPGAQAAPVHPERSRGATGMLRMNGGLSTAHSGPSTPLGMNGVERDVWVIGGPDTAALASARGWSSISVDDSAGDGTSSLELCVAPAKKRRASALRVALPEPNTQVRLLRDPFDWNRPKPQPPPRKKGQAPVIALHPTTELAFSHDAHRLLARTEAGSVVAIPVRNTARAGYGWPTLAELPHGTSLVASVWSSRRARGLMVARPDGAIHFSDWDGRLGVRVALSAPRPLPHELFTASWPAAAGWEMRGTWFDSAGRGDVDPALIRARACGVFVGALKCGSQVEVSVRGNQRILSVVQPPERAWLGSDGVLSAVCQYADRVDVLTHPTKDVLVRSLPLALFVNRSILGLSGPRVFALNADKRTIHSLAVDTVAPQWKEEACARAAIETVAIAPYGRYLAWRDAEGELAVYARDRGEVVLRLNARNVSVERA